MPRKRADEPDLRIERTDRLIDEMVHKLSARTGEEVELVEAAVGDE